MPSHSFSILLHLHASSLLDMFLSNYCKWQQTLLVLTSCQSMHDLLCSTNQTRFPHFLHIRNIVMQVVQQQIQSVSPAHHFFPRLFHAMHVGMSDLMLEMPGALLDTPCLCFYMVTSTESPMFTTFRKNRIVVHFFASKRSHQRVFMNITHYEIDRRMEPSVYRFFVNHPLHFRIIDGSTPWIRILEQVHHQDSHFIIQ